MMIGKNKFTLMMIVEKHFHHLFLLLLTLVNLVFLGYLLQMAYYNRFALDDFVSYLAYKQYGVFGAIAKYYEIWTGRFAALGFSMLGVWLYERTQSLLLHSLLIISGYVFIFYKILHKIIPKTILSSRAANLLIINLSGLLFIFLILVNYDLSSFFWFCAAPSYFGGILFTCFGINELFSSSRNFFSFLWLAFSFTVVGGCVENAAFVTLFLLSLYLFLQVISRFRALPFEFTRTVLHFYKTLIGCFFLFASFLISVTAPGTHIRQAAFRVWNFERFLLNLRKNIPDFFHNILPSKFGYFWCLFFIMVCVGVYFRKGDAVPKDKLSVPFLLMFGILLMAILFSIAPSIYATGGVGPDRSFLIVAFFLLCFVAYFSFQLGYATLFPKKFAYTLACISLLVVLYDGRFRWVNEVAGAKIYAQDYDQQIQMLLELKAKNNKKAVALPPVTFPPASLARHGLSADSLSSANDSFIQFLDLDFRVYAK